MSSIKNNINGRHSQIELSTRNVGNKNKFLVSTGKRVWEYTSETGTPFEVLADSQQTHRLFLNPRPWPTHNVCIVNAKSISVHLINRYVRIQNEYTLKS